MSLDFNPVENGVQCRSHEKCKEGSERQTEHDGGGHTSEDDIEQQRHTSEYGGQGCHQYRPCLGYRSLDDGLLRSRSGTRLDVGFGMAVDETAESMATRFRISRCMLTKAASYTTMALPTSIPMAMMMAAGDMRCKAIPVACM